MSPAKDDKKKPAPKEKHPKPSEASIDETLDESFPASDLPSWTGMHAGDGHAGDPSKKKKL